MQYDHQGKSTNKNEQAAATRPIGRGENAHSALIRIAGTIVILAGCPAQGILWLGI
jgi:hypothetical protein